MDQAPQPAELSCPAADRPASGNPVPASHRPSLFETLTSVETLTQAWQTVLARDARDGTLTAQTQRIAADPKGFINQLSQELRAGTYRPGPLWAMQIAKNGGGAITPGAAGTDQAARGQAAGTPGARTRTLRIPTIRDRVVERALVNTLSQRVDLLLSPCCFAYRTGLGRDDAIHHVTMLRDAGYLHVLRTDVRDYFPNLDVSQALRVLGRAVRCERTLALVGLVARPRRARGERRCRSRGIAQGSTLSPLLANLVLADVDHQLCDAGFGYARFADDIIVCSPSREDLAHGARLLRALVGSLGLSLNEEKTSMTSFDEGFCYLGVELTRTQPAVDPRHDVKGHPDPDHVVYVGREGSRVRVSKGRLLVEADSGIPQMSIPRHAVCRLVLTGAVGLSAGARSWALRHDVDVVFLSRRGSYLGRLAAPRATASARRLLAQAAVCADESARLPLARSIVEAKLRHQVGLLQRLGRRQKGVQVGDVCAQLRTLMGDAAHAADTAELMGLEGAASLLYFEELSRLVPAEVVFEGRSRRPPRDLANAALSYGYAILLAECVGALLSAGLEPSLGVLHASTDKRPSLALDLMEEFRPLLVDRTVMALLRQRRLRPEHAVESPDGAGVWLERRGKKALVDGYEATMQRTVSGALPGFQGSWRRHVHHQAQRLARALLEPGESWEGVSWR